MLKSYGYHLYGIALFVCAALPANAEEVPIDVAALKGAVLSETNAYRGSKKLAELRQNAALDAAAAAYAMYLAGHDGMGHTADGRTPAKRVIRPRIQMVLRRGERLGRLAEARYDAGR